MRPIYTFQLTVGQTAQRCFPIYKDDLTKDFEQESNQQFFRAKLSGKLTFERNDYDRIVNAAFDTQFLFDVLISYDAGQTWAVYWTGTFWKTDCEFDGDAKTVTVTPTVKDQYNDVLAGMEKEYNLIELLPEIVPVKLDKRPMIQVYVPGQSVIGCFLSGMWWEQEAEPESDETKLVSDFKFALNKIMTIGEISGSMSPQLPESFSKTTNGNSRFNPREQGTTEFTGTTYKLVYTYGAGSGGSQYSWRIVRISDNTILWAYTVNNQFPPALPVTVTLTPVSGSGASGNVNLSVYDIPVYSRFVCDTQTVGSLSTYPIPADDIVENNRNYTRVIGYYFPDTIYFSTRLTTTPNQWGIYQPGQYYQEPYLYWSPELYPVARNAWGRVSIWFTFAAFDWITEESGRQSFVLRDAFPLSSVISVLLTKILGGQQQTTRTIPESENTKYGQYINGSVWASVATVYCEIIPLRSGYNYKITFANGLGGYCLITDSQPKSNGQSVNFVSGYTTQINTTQGQIVNIQGVTGQYLYVRADSVSNGRVFPVIEETNAPVAITHQATTDYSQFLYGTNPISDVAQTLFITPKSNLVFSGYDQPAQKAPITLKSVMDMLRDCFRCYWFIDAQNRFRIEHISYFMNGGTYYGTPVVGTDLTTNKVTRNGKPWAFGRNQYKFDKPEMAARYQFGWMDDVTQLFEGYPIDIISKYVNPDNIEQIDVSKFTSDVDYILLNPGEISKDGFVLLAAIYQSGQYVLPYINFEISNTDHILQNALVAFIFLQRYYMFDMPASNVEINGVQQYVQGIKKLKTQTIKFPMWTDPDLVKLVKTDIGNGMIQKLSVNLSSRNANATLKYDTE